MVMWTLIHPDPFDGTFRLNKLAFALFLLKHDRFDFAGQKRRFIGQRFEVVAQLIDMRYSRLRISLIQTSRVKLPDSPSPRLQH